MVASLLTVPSASILLGWDVAVAIYLAGEAPRGASQHRGQLEIGDLGEFVGQAGQA